MALLAGFLIFYAFERILRLKLPHHAAEHSHGHSHSQASVTTEVDASRASTTRSSTRRSKSPARQSGTKSASTASQSSGHKDDNSPSSSKDAVASKIQPPEVPSNSVSAVAYLSLVADATHNFTDGLVIGASFEVSWLTGLSSTLAILAHEIPHEIGDVAVLMQAGFGKWRAIRAQLLTAFGALLGTCVGILSGQFDAGLVLNVTAGGMMYVSCVGLVGELLSHREDDGFLRVIFECLSFAFGVFLMWVVCLFEE